MANKKAVVLAVQTDDDFVNQLRSMTPGCQFDRQDEVVIKALKRYLEIGRYMAVPQETLREISGRAGLKPIIDTPERLVRAFEIITELDHNSVVMHLDEYVAIQLRILAKSTGMTLGEQLAQVYHRMLSMGWILPMDEKRYVTFGKDEWDRLRFETGKRSPSGSDLIQEIIRRPKPEQLVTEPVPSPVAESEAALVSGAAVSLEQLMSEATGG